MKSQNGNGNHRPDEVEVEHTEIKTFSNVLIGLVQRTSLPASKNDTT